MEIAELPYTVIELMHDVERHCWGIPLGDGTYFYISQQVLEQIYDLKYIREHVNKRYGIDLPLSAYEAMREMRNHMSRYVYVPLINPVGLSVAGKSRHIPSLYLY